MAPLALHSRGYVGRSDFECSLDYHSSTRYAYRDRHANELMEFAVSGIPYQPATTIGLIWDFLSRNIQALVYRYFPHLYTRDPNFDNQVRIQHVFEAVQTELLRTLAEFEKELTIRLTPDTSERKETDDVAPDELSVRNQNLTEYAQTLLSFNEALKTHRIWAYVDFAHRGFSHAEIDALKARIPECLLKTCEHATQRYVTDLIMTQEEFLTSAESPGFCNAIGMSQIDRMILSPNDLVTVLQNKEGMIHGLNLSLLQAEKLLEYPDLLARMSMAQINQCKQYLSPTQVVKMLNHSPFLIDRCRFTQDEINHVAANPNLIARMTNGQIKFVVENLDVTDAQFVSLLKQYQGEKISGIEIPESKFGALIAHPDLVQRLDPAFYPFLLSHAEEGDQRADLLDALCFS